MFGKRILGVIFLLLGTVGFLACVAGVVGVWKVRDPLRERLAQVVAQVEEVLGRAKVDLGAVHTALARSQTDLRELKNAPPAEQDRSRKLLAQGLARKLGPGTGDLRASLTRVAEASVVLDNVLQEADALAAGRGDRLNAGDAEDLSKKLAGVARKSWELSVLFPERGQGPSDADLDSARRKLDEVQTVVTECQERVDTFEAKLQRLKAGADVWTARGPYVVTGVLGLFGLGQLALFLWGVSLMRRRPAA
jgi:hypothetical protein